MRRGTAVLGFVALFAFAAAQPASATIVYEHDEEIWAMNDDGSDQRLLAAGGPVGMEQGLSFPHVAPNGSTVVFQGATNANFHSCGGNLYFGWHAIGVYRWRDGAVARLSEPPARMPSCGSNFHEDPEATTNARVINVYRQYIDGIPGRGLQSGTQEGPTDTSTPSACPNDPHLSDPSPNPANAAQYAYIGCNGGGGEDVVAVSQGSSHTFPILDDAAQRAVAWRSDGTRLAVSEGGTEPGIWTYGPAAPVDPVHVLNGDFADVGFAGAGNDRILFSSAGDIWSIPASCTAASCSMANATRLTASGANDHPSWTAADLRAPSTGGGGGVTTTTDGGGGGNVTPQPTTGGGGATVDLATLIQRSRVGSASSRGGVVFRIELAAPATLEFTFQTVKGRKRKKFGTVRKAGRGGANTVKIKKVGRKKFRKGKYRAQIRAIANGQKGPAKSVTFSVKR